MTKRFTTWRKLRRKQKFLNSLSFGTDVSGQNFDPKDSEASLPLDDAGLGRDYVEIVPPYYNEDGTMSEDYINDKIDAWHLEGAGKGLELHEYLGWTWEQYCRWVKTGEVPSSH